MIPKCQPNFCLIFRADYPTENEERYGWKRVLPDFEYWIVWMILAVNEVVEFE